MTHVLAPAMDLLQFDLFDDLSNRKGCSSYAPPEKVRVKLWALWILSIIGSVDNFLASTEISG